MRQMLFFLAIFYSCFALAQNKFVSGIYFAGDKADSTLQVSNASDTVNIFPTPIVSIKNFKKVRVVKEGSGTSAIEIAMDEAGSGNFASATEKWLEKKMAFVIDGKLLLSPTVKSKITGGVVWMSYNMSKREAKRLKQTIEKEMRE